jgi:outer membrane protein assembly factor BamB
MCAKVALPGSLGSPMIRQRRNLNLLPLALVLALALTLAACGTSQARIASRTPSASTFTPTAAPGPLMIDAAKASWSLRFPLQREVALADGQRLQILGGLTPSGVSTSAVIFADPVTGALTAGPALPRGVHDAAGAMISGRPTIFGGGAATSVDTVQQAGGAVIGALPTARSDLAAAVIGKTTYLIGGYDGSVLRREVLATTDGKSFQQVARLPQGLRYPAVAALGATIYVIGGELANGKSTRDIVAVDSATGRVATLGQLPRPISQATAVVLGGELFVLGGMDGPEPTDKIWRIDPSSGMVSPAGLLPYAVSDAAAAIVGQSGYMVGGNGSNGATLATAITLTVSAAPPAISYTAGPTGLARGSDPSVLPGPVLIADEGNNRLIEISPAGQVLWQFPRPGDLAPGQTFKMPDDAFFSPDGTEIIATQEENFAVTLINIATHKIVWRYGLPGVHGSGPNRLWNPDDAMVLPNGDVVIADIINCRIIVVARGGHTVAHGYGQVGSCYHNPPLRFGSPNGAFPLSNGNWLVTEINGDWVSEMAPGGKVLWSTHPPGIAYPSDTNEIGPNRYLSVDYSFPGQIVIFDRAGRTIWRYRPTGAFALNHPSLALPLPNGDILLNDDANHRVIVVDPRTNQVVWQYGVTARPGSTVGLLNNPDGLDLVPPYSLLGTHAATLQTP